MSASTWQPTEYEGVKTRVDRRGQRQYLASAPWRGGPSKTFTKLADARQWRHDVASERGDGVKHQKRSERQRVADAATDWLAHRAASTSKPWQPATYIVNESRLRLMIVEQPIGRRWLDEVGVSDVERWRDQLVAQGYSAKVVSQAKSQLARIFARAVRDRVLTFNPVKDAENVSLAKPVTKVAPLDRDVAALKACEVERDRLALDLAYSAGLRFSEVAGLTLDQIEGDSLVIDRQWDRDLARFAPPKHVRSVVVPVPRELARVVPVPHGLVVAIRAYVKRYGLSDAGTILSEPQPRGSKTPDGGAVVLDQHRFNYRWRQARRMSKTSLRGIHELRHAYGSNLLDAGENPANIAAWMGHKNVSTFLDTYARPVAGAVPSVDLYARAQEADAASRRQTADKKRHLRAV